MSRDLRSFTLSNLDITSFQGMKSLLGLQRVNASSLLSRRKLKQFSLTECAPEKTIDLDDSPEYVETGYGQFERKLEANDYICFLNVYVVFLFGNDFTVEGTGFDSMNPDVGIPIEPTNNVLFVGTGEWKITATAATTLNMVTTTLSVSLIVNQIDGYLVFDNWEGTLKGSYTLSENGATASGDLFLFAVNTNSATITGSTKDSFIDMLTGDMPQELSVTIPRVVTGDNMKYPFLFAFILRKDIVTERPNPGTYEVSGTVKVESQQNLEVFPKKNYKITFKNQVGITNGEVGDSLKGTPSSLGAGEIAAISIACLVVVGLAAFCIVWFVVLKKGCGKSSDDSSPSA